MSERRVLLFSANEQPNHALYRLWNVEQLWVYEQPGETGSIEVEAKIKNFFSADSFLTIFVPIGSGNSWTSFLERLGCNIAETIQDVLTCIPWYKIHECLSKHDSNLQRPLRMLECYTSSDAMYIKIMGGSNATAHKNIIKLFMCLDYEFPEQTVTNFEDTVSKLQQHIAQMHDAKFKYSTNDIVAIFDPNLFHSLTHYAVCIDGKWITSYNGHVNIKRLFAQIPMQAPPENEKTQIGYTIADKVEDQPAVRRVVGKNGQCILWQVNKFHAGYLMDDAREELNKRGVWETAYEVEFVNRYGVLCRKPYSMFLHPPIELSGNVSLPTDIEDVEVMLDNGTFVTSHPDQYDCEVSDCKVTIHEENGTVYDVTIQHKHLKFIEDCRFIYVVGNTMFELSPRDWRVARWRQRYKLIKHLTAGYNI